MTVLYWVTRDLRVGENAALAGVLSQEEALLCVAIDGPLPQERPLSNTQRWWWYESLRAFSTALKKESGAILNFVEGDAESTLLDLCQIHGVKKVVTSAIFEPAYAAAYRGLKQKLAHMGASIHVINTNYLTSPKDILTPKNTVYKVYTPFKNAVEHQLTGGKGSFSSAPSKKPRAIVLDQSRPIPKLQVRASIAKAWTPGESGALQAWKHFTKELGGYATQRDLPGCAGTSRLSPHLHFGEISPRYLLGEIMKLRDKTPSLDKGAHVFLNELIWREFAAYTLFHNPTMVDRPFNPRFTDFDWQEDDHAFKAWCAGQTGVPLVDAGIHELLETGWMHNRVRMVVASFLTKNLNIHWRQGESFFWEHLVDADLASNVFNWQWVAGCGTDAAPFFRIFNPFTQAEKFDPHGQYCHRWAPGSSSKNPIVDLASSRKLALARFQALKV